MNPLPPIRRIFIAPCYFVSIAKNTRHSKALHKFIEVAALDEGDATDLYGLQRACTNTVYQKLARESRELRRLCKSQGKPVDDWDCLCYGSPRRLCSGARLHIDHRNHSANGRAATGAGHKSHWAARLLLAVALEISWREPGFFAVFAVVIDNVQVASTNRPLNTTGGDTQQLSCFTLGHQFHGKRIAYLRHMRQKRLMSRVSSLV